METEIPVVFTSPSPRQPFMAQKKPQLNTQKPEMVMGQASLTTPLPTSPPVPASSARRIGAPTMESPVLLECDEVMPENDGEVMFESMAEERMR